MHQLTRRALLAGMGATAATALAPVGIHRALAQKPLCIRPLQAFLEEAKQTQHQLTGDQRRLIVEQGIKLLDEFYCHLPLKQKLYGARPLERLRELRKLAGGFNSDQPFHARMMAIFTELRDQHTRYRMPRPYGNAFAFLPFRIEACVENGRRKHIVSRIAREFEDASPPLGAEVLRWNGNSIERAAERAGGDGATPSARRCIGLARLTQRLLQLHPVPEEESVNIRYRAGNKEQNIEVQWQVASLQLPAPVPHPCFGACGGMQEMDEFRKFLFAKYDVCSFPFKSEFHKTPEGDVFGYIRIFSFENIPLDPMDRNKVLTNDMFVEAFRQEVAKYADTKGLIVDVRDNAGGSTRASERILQSVSPAKEINPSTLVFRATERALEFCQLPKSVSDLGPDGLRPWIESMKRALATRRMFSDAFQYTKQEEANDSRRQIFPRPVIVVTSGMTWSAGELFAAGFQDHGGTILGVDETTGGGGAGYRQMTQLSKYFTDDHHNSPYANLTQDAHGAGFQVAFRRSKRVNRGVGKEIEDAGVARNRPYALTRNDVLNDNHDLKNHAAGLLARMK